MDEILKSLSRIEQLTLLGVKTVLTIDEASLLTGFSVDSLRRAVGKRELGAFRPRGKNLFFDKKSLERWMMRGQIMAKDEVAQTVVAHKLAKHIRDGV